MSDNVKQNTAGVERRRKNTYRPASERVRLPPIKEQQCDFQRNNGVHDPQKSKQRPRSEEPRPTAAKPMSLVEALPAIMARFKAEIGTKSFIRKTRAAVNERRRLERLQAIALEQRRWIKGSEMAAFFHVWQTSVDHVKDQHVRPGTVQTRRVVGAVPKSFKALEQAAERHRKDMEHSDFGIIRDCCSKPRYILPPLMND
ncbi:uncharacterized protein LOC128243847 [Mya arenaria]|uniref:uncharacterized protein LOC128243847 n=1 Tax=Mya arenaria TaxID=6604 RepID=UPI0022E6F9B0|nr:uncharacterized protein LOC128243847 [Mya arenaria]